MTATVDRVSQHVAGITVSAIKEMAIRGAKVDGAASLTWGLPSFETPEHIRCGIEKALEADPDIGKYALPDGLSELRDIVAQVHQDATGVATDADRNVMITAGNMQGLNALFHVLINPGDEIIVTDPGFASHFQQIRLCGGRPVFWPMDEARGWRLDVAALDSLVTEKSKAIVLVTPSNPTGVIFSEQDLRHVGQVARQRDLMILIDDPYSHFAYENHDRIFNLSSVTELFDHIAYLFTFSKSYAMSGWRVGYMIVPAAIKKEVLKVHDATIICTPRISQVAAIVGLSEPPVHLTAFEAVLARRRALICERLDRLNHVFSYVKPEGAYYVFPKILVPHKDSSTFAIDLLEHAKVIVTPGSAFGPRGESRVRMAFCVADDVINSAFDRMDRYFGT